MTTHHTLGVLKQQFLVGLQSNLSCVPLCPEVLIVEPWKLELKRPTSTHLIFNIFEYHQDIRLLPKLHTEQRPDAFGQPEIGVGVEQRERQRVNSS